MEHPGLDVTQIKNEMNLEQIQQKITDLYKRLSFSYRTGNQSLINQISMVLETYTRAQNEILDEMYGNSGHGPTDDKIDIS